MQTRAKVLQLGGASTMGRGAALISPSYLIGLALTEAQVIRTKGVSLTNSSFGHKRSLLWIEACLLLIVPQ